MTTAGTAQNVQFGRVYAADLPHPATAPNGGSRSLPWNTSGSRLARFKPALGLAAASGLADFRIYLAAPAI